MDKATILGIVRHVMTAGGGYFVGQGLVDQETATSIVAGLVALVGVVWSVLQKKGKAA